MPLPPWLSGVLAAVLGIGALAVLTWAAVAKVDLGDGLVAIYSALVAGLVGWQLPSPTDRKKARAELGGEP